MQISAFSCKCESHSPTSRRYSGRLVCCVFQSCKDRTCQLMKRQFLRSNLPQNDWKWVCLDLEAHGRSTSQNIAPRVSLNLSTLSLKSFGREPDFQHWKKNEICWNAKIWIQFQRTINSKRRYMSPCVELRQLGLANWIVDN